GSNVQIWRPMDGSASAAHAAPDAIVESYAGNQQPGLQPATYTEAAGFTTVELGLAARESAFVVFRNNGQQLAPAPSPTRHTVMMIRGPWTVAFPPHLGAPETIRLDKPDFWTRSSNLGVKFFSGTATYSTSFTVTSSVLHGKHLILHLGDVRDIAQIRINGKSTGITWAPPYDVDVTGTLHPGSNKVEIRVTNEWTNRILGDSSLPANHRILPGVPPTRFGPPPALPDSGLSGDVALLSDATR
ncbi:MAG TPA: glycoside hydrolase, partial [Terracidiphilus sp.]